MNRRFDLGEELEGSQSINERAARLARLDALILRGIVDADAGRVHELDVVVKALSKKWAK